MIAPCPAFTLHCTHCSTYSRCERRAVDFPLVAADVMPLAQLALDVAFGKKLEMSSTADGWLYFTPPVRILDPPCRDNAVFLEGLLACVPRQTCSDRFARLVFGTPICRDRRCSC